jgi:hypothetical protein
MSSCAVNRFVRHHKFNVHHERQHLPMAISTIDTV